jgi:hypothetical protein
MKVSSSFGSYEIHPLQAPEQTLSASTTSEPWGWMREERCSRLLSDVDRGQGKALGW